MPGEEERHHFIAQLAIVHLTAILVLRLQQHRKEIAFITPARSPLANNTKDYLVNLRYPPMKAEMCRGREAIVENPTHRRLGGKRFDELAEDPTHAIGIARDFGIEERLDDDLQRQSHHVSMN